MCFLFGLREVKSCQSSFPEWAHHTHICQNPSRTSQNTHTNMATMDCNSHTHNLMFTLTKLRNVSVAHWLLYSGLFLFLLHFNKHVWILLRVVHQAERHTFHLVLSTFTGNVEGDPASLYRSYWRLLTYIIKIVPYCNNNFLFEWAVAIVTLIYQSECIYIKLRYTQSCCYKKKTYHLLTNQSTELSSSVL